MDDTLHQILTQLLSIIPEKYRATVATLFLASPLITRAIYALMNRGGLKGICSAIWLGTNTPKAKSDSATEPQPPKQNQ